MIIFISFIFHVTIKNYIYVICLGKTGFEKDEKYNSLKSSPRPYIQLKICFHLLPKGGIVCETRFHNADYMKQNIFHSMSYMNRDFYFIVLLLLFLY